MVAKLLDRARSINIRPDPEDAVAPAPAPVKAEPAKPVVREVIAPAPAPASAPVVEEPAAPVAEVRREPAPARKPRKPEPVRAEAPTAGQGRSVSRTFDIVTGPSTRALTVRIPEDVHARLVLIATSNRLARTGQAATLNELIAEGIDHVLDRYDAA